jgi:hypothetical protein
MKKDSWLYSDSFLKRAFAIYGYSLVASLIIAVPVWIVGMVIAFIVAANIQTAP